MKYALYSVEREGGEPEAVISIPVFNLKTATPRQQVFHELVTTESNYVGILDCVTKISEVSLTYKSARVRYTYFFFIDLLIYIPKNGHFGRFFKFFYLLLITNYKK